MATGDQSDVLNRLMTVLPTSWFDQNENPIVDGLLAAFSNLGSTIYSQFAYEQLQTRITTATDINLDQIAVDFFGQTGLLRNSGEGDASYRNRILSSVLRERATRRGMILFLTLLTGIAPVIFEPTRPADCGGYGIAGAGYSVAGGWSNTDPSATEYQCFITVFTPVVSAIASVAGWNIDTGGWNTPSRLAWENRNVTTNALDAAEIYAAINDTKCEGTVCWVALVNPS